MRGGHIIVAHGRRVIERPADDDADLRREVVAELLKALANGRSGSSHGGGSIQ